MTEPDDKPDAIWVISDVPANGSPNYIVTVQASNDIALSLNAKQAGRYANTVIRAAVIARHDAAVLRQLCARPGGGVSREAAAQTIADLRRDRPPLQHGMTAPLTFEPIVSATSFAPYVHVSAGTHKIAQWTPDDCFQHAGHVLEVLAGVDLDSAYLRYLTRTIGLDEPTARAAVNGLGNMDGEEEST